MGDLKQACDYFGWQGGTCHQVSDEIVDRLDCLFLEHCDSPGRRVDLAIEFLRDVGVSDYSETSDYLKRSMYGGDCGRGSVVDIVCGIR